MAKLNLQWHFNTLPDGITGIDGNLVSKATFLPFYFSVNEPQTESLPVAVTN